MMPFPTTNDAGRPDDEQHEHRERDPRVAPVRRDAARGHVPGRRGLLLERPDRPAADRPARLLRQPPAVHHPPDRRRAEPRHAARLPDDGPQRRVDGSQLPVPRHRTRSPGSSTPAAATQAPVTTFVIGFAVSSATIDSTLFQCSQLAAGGTLVGHVQRRRPGPAAPECGRQRVLPAPGRSRSRDPRTSSRHHGHAEREPDAGVLRRHAGRAAGGARRPSSRTSPERDDANDARVLGDSSTIYADPTNAPTNVGSEFLASFNPSPGKPWSGDVLRSARRLHGERHGRVLGHAGDARPDAGRRLRRRTSTRTRAARGSSSPSSPTPSGSRWGRPSTRRRPSGPT